MGSTDKVSVDQLIASLEGISASSFANEAERIRARDAVFEALRRIQSPWDIAWDHVWVSGAINACIKALIDAGVFTKWAEAGGEPITCTRLAELTGADEVLIRRLMRAIAGQHLVIEVGPDTYARTPWAKTLVEDKAFPSLYGGFYHELNNPMFHTLPGYLKSTNFRNPTNVNDCNFQYWRGKDANMFAYVGTNPALTAHFNDAMECHSKYNLSSWVDIYPTDTVIEAAVAKAKTAGEAATKPPLVVDVGGGKGHDLRKFLARHPNIPKDSLVLEDLADILKGVEEEIARDGATAIQVRPHDFFQPQPDATRGARIYFMHNVLHDWPDETALTILKALAPAMEKGYSRLLIHESFVTNEKPLARVTVSDITMMACLAAAERSEEQWKGLLEKAGMRLLKIWKAPDSVESIIEAEVV